MLVDLPGWYFNCVAIAFGLLTGSFLNVVIARLPKGESIVRPRSKCPSCGTMIAAYDNIPVVSWIALRGRCRHCKAAISVRYPIVELLTAVLFLAARHRYGFSLSLVVRDWPILSILVALTFIDLDHRILPDKLTLGGTALALATSWMDPRLGVFDAILGAGLGFGVFYLLAWAYLAFTGRSGLGGGDIKLLAMLGAFLGPGGVLTAILISSVFGSLVGIVWGLVQKEKNLMTVAIPYGPFLVVGGLFHYLLGDYLWLRLAIPMPM